MNINKCEIVLKDEVARITVYGLNPLGATQSSLLEIDIQEDGSPVTRVFPVLGAEYNDTGTETVYVLDISLMPIGLRDCRYFDDQLFKSTQTEPTPTEDFSTKGTLFIDRDRIEVPTCENCDADNKVLLIYPEGTFSSEYIWLEGTILFTNLGICQIEKIEYRDSLTVITVLFNNPIEESCSIDFSNISVVPVEIKTGDKKGAAAVGSYIVSYSTRDRKLYSYEVGRAETRNPRIKEIPNSPTAIFSLNRSSCFVGTNEGVIYKFYPKLQELVIVEGGDLIEVKINSFDVFGDHVVAFCDRNIIKYSDSDGDSWETLLGPTVGQDITKGLLSNLYSMFILQESGRLFFSDDFGGGWTFVAGSPSFSEKIVDFTMYTKNVGYYITNDRIYRTTDGGYSWQLDQQFEDIFLTSVVCTGVNSVKISAKDQNGKIFIIDGEG